MNQLEFATKNIHVSCTIANCYAFLFPNKITKLKIREGVFKLFFWSNCICHFKIAKLLSMAAAHWHSQKGHIISSSIPPSCLIMILLYMNHDQIWKPYHWIETKRKEENTPKHSNQPKSKHDDHRHASLIIGEFANFLFLKYPKGEVNTKMTQNPK